MLKRDVSAGLIGFSAAMGLFAMAHYLAAPRLAMAVFVVVSATAFLVAVVSYALAVARPNAPQTAAPRPQAVAVSSPAD